MSPRDHAGQNVAYVFFMPLNNANDGLFEALSYIEMFHAGLLYGWLIPVGIWLGAYFCAAVMSSSQRLMCSLKITFRNLSELRGAS